MAVRRFFLIFPERFKKHLNQVPLAVLILFSTLLPYVLMTLPVLLVGCQGCQGWTNQGTVETPMEMGPAPVTFRGTVEDDGESFYRVNTTPGLSYTITLGAEPSQIADLDVYVYQDISGETGQGIYCGTIPEDQEVISSVTCTVPAAGDSIVIKASMFFIMDNPAIAILCLPFLISPERHTREFCTCKDGREFVVEVR